MYAMRWTTQPGGAALWYMEKEYVLIAVWLLGLYAVHWTTQPWGASLWYMDREILLITMWLLGIYAVHWTTQPWRGGGCSPVVHEERDGVC